MAGVYRDPEAARAELLAQLGAEAEALGRAISAAEAELRALHGRVRRALRRRWAEGAFARFVLGVVTWIATTVAGGFLCWMVGTIIVAVRHPHGW